MIKCVDVRLREAGKIEEYNTADLNCAIGDVVIVEAERGVEYGYVYSEARDISNEAKHKGVRKIIRKATEADIAQIEENQQSLAKPLRICEKKIRSYKLEMNLVKAEYSFDKSKLVFYFTADGRIDFRDLVKDLARIFGVRIELRQIGARDETKIHGGYGPCGRELCCAAFLRDFDAVSIRMAKDQRLPLNQDQLSGVCGRLKCCLAYEHCFYKQALKNLPREGDMVTTSDGVGKVISLDILKRICRVQFEDGRVVEYPGQACKCKRERK